MKSDAEAMAEMLECIKTLRDITKAQKEQIEALHEMSKSLHDMAKILDKRLTTLEHGVVYSYGNKNS